MLFCICIPLSFSYVLGHEAMRKMGTANVLISGMKGLGVEIGKHSPQTYRLCVYVARMVLLQHCRCVFLPAIMNMCACGDGLLPFLPLSLLPTHTHSQGCSAGWSEVGDHP